jgi:GNAT superfamily N-acetyltransferase
MPAITIQPFADQDAGPIQDLFIRVNRLLAPPHLAAAFEVYIARSIDEEIGCIALYYGTRGGGFWVARDGADLVGMFGLEPASSGGMELRRMYVAPEARRRGIAHAMLRFAEAETVRCGADRLVLSTSELQAEALALYRSAGYQLLREEIATEASNKALGGGLRRFHFEKRWAAA